MSDRPDWYKDAIFYEVRVRAFFDSDGDGIGDFRGLTAKLDYLQDLGIDTLWLLPFYPSPLRDDGYDISDYTDVHRDCGTLQDFKAFIRAAHRRGLHVVTELVLNHTSDQHPWFQRARRAKPGTRWRDFYVWSDDPHRYREARIIFKDFETSNWAWDPVAESYYWHRFYANQPDLNYDNPEVRRAVLQVLDFWLGLGVDGLRLDAVPYLFERDGTNCENLPETHALLKAIRAHVDRKFKSRMLLAEANQWPEDAAAYFGDGDECNMCFHFPIMPRLFMALHMEDRFPIVDILQQTPPLTDSSQWGLFLRNHDELTLEMVTDEERDYMYRVYAHDPQARINLGIRRRLAPLLGNDRRRIELMNALLFSLPGTPILYYGDEIGMGDNFYLGDRNGVRTPMQWNGDRSAGFSKANPQRLYLPVVIDPEYHYETVNVEAQQANPHSLLWWTKRLIALRRRYHAFGRGSIEFLHPSNRKVLAFIRRYENEHILVVANLSRFVQFVELELGAYREQIAVELFGGSEFPQIGDLPYLLTLGPHAFYWFAIEPKRRDTLAATTETPRRLPALTASGSWERILTGDDRRHLEAVLPPYLVGKRWFGGKGRAIKRAAIADAVPLPGPMPTPHLTLVRVEYRDGAAETYLLPLAFAAGGRAEELLRWSADFVVAELTLKTKTGETMGVVHDAAGDRDTALALLDAVVRQRKLRAADGEIVGAKSSAFRRLLGDGTAPLEPRALSAEQSNSSVVFGDRFILKLFRRVEDGVNPDLEIGRFLTERTTFSHIAPLAGHLEHRALRREPRTLAVVQGFVPNEGDAWQYTLDEVERYFERALIPHRDVGVVPLPHGSQVELAGVQPTELAEQTVGTYLPMAHLLGRRTAEMHLALASGADDPAFAPEAFSTLYQRSLYQSMRNLSSQVFALLADNVHRLPQSVREDAEHVRTLESRVQKAFRAITGCKITATRIRCHGDYHLGQVLHTGKDFIIIDFEGEPARPLGERRIKRSPLRDVAAMTRSFHYAAYSVLATRVAGRTIRQEEVARAEPWARFWFDWVSSRFLDAYLTTARGASFIPHGTEELELLLGIYTLEKAVYELGYELNNRPDWVWVPLAGIAQLLAPVAVAS